MGTKGEVTANTLAAMRPGDWVTCDKGLEARCSTSGEVLFYARWRPKGKNPERVALARWASRVANVRKDIEGLKEAQARGVLTLEQARRYTELVLPALKVEANRHGITLAELKAREATAARKVVAEQLQAEAEAQQAAEAARGATLGGLLAAYIAHLREKRKHSAEQVASRIQRNLFDAQPELCARPAKEIGTVDIVHALRPVAAAGKERTAGALRSYIHAAYELALGAANDPRSPVTVASFGVAVNPAASVKAIPIATRDRVLSDAELKAYVSALEGLPDTHTRAALWLCLRLGGQRATQVLRLTVADVDLSAGRITLRDPKGKRREGPREHALPLPDDTKALFTELAQRSNGRGLFGRTRLETLSKAVAALSARFITEGTSAEPFTLADIRRTAETQLASLAVSKDTRAHLLSHGLSGLQAQRYDRFDYWEEKRAALETWGRFLREGRADSKAEVIPLTPRAIA